MKTLLTKATLLSQVFFVAVLTSTISIAATGLTQTNTANLATRSFSKTNPELLRNTDKTQKQRSGGVYKTQAVIKSNLEERQNVNAVNLSQPRLRQDKKNLQRSTTSAFGFEIFDASVLLVGDQDNDGFYSDFDIEMDVDVDSGSANVYAEVYYLNANGEWQFLTSTDVFSITGNLASDRFTTAITLVDGFPDNYYDLLIDVYEDGIPGIVATLQASDDSDLALVPLEDLNFDSSANANDLLLDTLSMNLVDDFDFDGFYTGFDFEVSLQNETFGRRLQAIFYSRDTVTDWYVETSTASVFVNRGETVSFNISGDWNTGYVTDYYDFLVEIVDADTGEIVDDFGPEYNALFERPMESNDYDEAVDTVIIVEDSYSSGSTDVVLLLLLSLFIITKKLMRTKPLKQEE